jgi:ketopantoate reductase
MRKCRLREDRPGKFVWVDPATGDFEVYPVQASGDPALVGPVDLVLMTVKSYDLEDAAQAGRPLIGPETAALPLLKGLDAAGPLAAEWGGEPHQPTLDCARWHTESRSDGVH